MPEFSVTILVCTRNRPQQLSRCLTSISSLNYNKYDLIIVDNGSERITVPELNYPRRTRFFSYPIPGLSGARNAVLPFITGDLLALLDDDAVAQPDWLIHAATPFENSRVGCVAGRIIPLEVKTEWHQKILENPYIPNWDEPREFDAKSFNPFTSQIGTGSNLVIRSSVFEAIQFPEFLGPGTPSFAADEHYLFYKLAQSGWILKYEPSAVVRHEYPGDEETHNLRILRGGVSRGAYLTRFLLHENGYRLATLKYLLRRRNQSNVKKGFRTSRRGLLSGPIAYLNSLRTKKSKGKLKLIREFVPVQ
jgi:glycosyltransferase involved in cell wall biosynthesis